MAVEQISSKEVAESSSRHHMVLGVRRLAWQLAARIWPLRRLQAPLSLAGKDALPCSLERLLGTPFLTGCWAEASLGSWPRRPLQEAAHRTAACFSGACQREGHRRASKGDSGTEVSGVGRCDTPLPWLSLSSEARPWSARTPGEGIPQDKTHGHGDHWGPRQKD